MNEPETIISNGVAKGLVGELYEDCVPYVRDMGGCMRLVYRNGVDLMPPRYSDLARICVSISQGIILDAYVI